ncbi:hypothetical protein Tsubulata_049277 [Turnera subulata]|uniref:Uncharacterized protein n=1 Tax=Turnera subulata TaxID=218843 RepID=A0A9Q0JNA5_9ROSI|nr:hypothetical protein Tsubulata_049277 [Turnera subulata]
MLFRSHTSDNYDINVAIVFEDSSITKKTRNVLSLIPQTGHYASFDFLTMPFQFSMTICLCRKRLTNNSPQEDQPVHLVAMGNSLIDHMFRAKVRLSCCI